MGIAYWIDEWVDAIYQRNEAARLYWKMRHDRNGWRALATEWAKSNSSLRRDVVAANARIAELEAQLAERDERKCETCASWRGDYCLEQINGLRYEWLGVSGLCRALVPLDPCEFDCSEWQGRET